MRVAVSLTAMVSALLAVWWLLPTDSARHGADAQPVEALRALSSDALDTGAAPDVVVAGSVRGDATPEALDAPTLAEPLADALPEELQVRIERPDGRPALHARLALTDVRGLLAGQGDVDTDGRWRHPGFDGPGVLYVRGVTPNIERFELGAARGEHALRLPEGETLHGRVLVDGAPPGRPFVVALPSMDLGGLPESTGIRLTPFDVPGEALTEMLFGVPTDALGRFELSSVPRDAALEFGGPWLYTLDRVESTPQPVRPTGETVVVALRSPAMLRGRVVDAEGEPTPSAVLDLDLHLTVDQFAPDGSVARSDGESLDDLALELDAEARFAYPLGDPRVQFRGPSAAVSAELFHLRARALDGGWFMRRVMVTDFTRDRDLGDLVLHPESEWVLRVVDAAGEPLPTATARNADGVWSEGRVSTFDADGLGLIRAPESAVEGGALFVRASGYFEKAVPLPDEPPADPIEVQLTASTNLIVRAHGPWEAAEVLAGWSFRLEIDGEDPIFVVPWIGEDAGTPEYRERLQQWRAINAQVREQGLLREDQDSLRPGPRTFRTLKSEWTVPEVRPRHRLTLRVGLDSVPFDLRPCPEAWVWEQEVTLEPGETRVIHADLSGWAAAR